MIWIALGLPMDTHRIMMQQAQPQDRAAPLLACLRTQNARNEILAALQVEEQLTLSVTCKTALAAAHTRELATDARTHLRSISGSGGGVQTGDIDGGLRVWTWTAEDCPRDDH